MRISDWSSDVCSSDLNYIVNAQGQRLTGYDATGTNIVPIKVPTGNISPQPTGSVDFTTNLDANSPVIPAAPVFDADDPSTYTHQQPMSVYDSLGNAHQFTQYFVKRADNGTTRVWDVYYTLDSAIQTSFTHRPNTTIVSTPVVRRVGTHWCIKDG